MSVPILLAALVALESSVLPCGIIKTLCYSISITRGFLLSLSMGARRSSRHTASGTPRRCVGGCARGFSLLTRAKGLSPIANERGRVERLVSVLLHHERGGPVLANRPNIKGDDVIRNLTLRITSNHIPSTLGGIEVLTLGVNTLLTKTDIEKRFRGHLGSLLARLGSLSNATVLFVSRTRSLVNTKKLPKRASTTGLLGPTLTHKRLHVVTTAA